MASLIALERILSFSFLAEAIANSSISHTFFLDSSSIFCTSISANSSFSLYCFCIKSIFSNFDFLSSIASTIFFHRKCLKIKSNNRKFII
ncbi:MAG: hypothetical protein Q8S84_02205 [bacterium]|nr:hypothetical protein [bacterium]MDP3380366.1 hypothetical protein [bacterium]